jgi:hypothetical protein
MAGIYGDAGDRKRQHINALLIDDRHRHLWHRRHVWRRHPCVAAARTPSSLGHIIYAENVMYAAASMRRMQNASGRAGCAGIYAKKDINEAASGGGPVMTGRGRWLASMATLVTENDEPSTTCP